MGHVGQVEGNIFNQPAISGLRKFQFIADPPIYKSAGLANLDF